jgi:hypothetical protein
MSHTIMDSSYDLYEKPLASVFQISLKEARKSAEFDDDIASALKDYFMMGAITAVNMLMTGHTFPDGQEVSYSANELSSEAMDHLQVAAGTIGDENEDEDE